jgi:CheY-like chemotaxis protein
MARSEDSIDVVLLDDEPGDRALILALLEDSAVKVTAAHDALAGLLEGLDRMLAPPDVLLVDLNLPDSTGIGTVESLRTAHPRIPLVVVTGDRLAARDAIVAGADDVVLKDALETDLERAVVHSRQRAVGRSGAPGTGFHLADAPLLVVDNTDETVAANRAAHQLMGFVPSPDATFTMLFHAEDRMEVATFLVSMSEASGMRVWAEARLLTPSGAVECSLTGTVDPSTDLAHITLKPVDG